MNPSDSIEVVKTRLMDAGGRLAQDFGFSRVAGQVLTCLYLTDGDASLDALEGELHLSKAAVSLACTQLERLGLIRRVRHAGDRKRYYRSAEDLGTALRHGVLTFTRARMAVLETDLKQADEVLSSVGNDGDIDFLAGRVARMQELNQRAYRLLGHPLLEWVARL